MAKSVDDIKSPLFWRAVFAEVVGTLFLVLVGCGSCITMDSNNAPTVVQIALCFGLIVGTMVWCTAHVSGGHINPAVTLSMLITRKISVARAILYVLAQCIGAILGAALLRGVTPAENRGSFGMTSPSISSQQAFGVEFLITFVLVLTVFASCDSKRTDLSGSGPLAIGLSVTVCHLFAVTYTGSSMNPARTFGPAVVSNSWHEHWVYWCGPLLGGVVAGLLYDNILAANASLRKARGYLLASEYEGENFLENKEKPAKILADEEA
jgi:aquaporin-4